MRKRLATLITAGVLLCVSSAGSAVTARELGDGPHSSAPSARAPLSVAQGPHSGGAAPLAKKIRTPRQCYYACLKLKGTSLDFCNASCYWAERALAVSPARAFAHRFAPTSIWAA